jgi:polysaccharide pyruvyl transferase WcaK-like protein/Flp pilus assembly protein TadD
MPDRAAAIFGTFDVENYGDLLFPHLAAWGLGGSVSELRCYSPNGSVVSWADTLPSEPVRKAIEASPPATLCLIGGGNIIDARPTPLAEYRARSTYAYPALWLGAAIVAARMGARIVWNAPGVPQPIEGAWARRLRDLVLPASDLLTVRDDASRVFLDLGRPSLAAVVPDTALALSRIWPGEELRGVAEAAFAARGSRAPERWIVVHLNKRYLNPSRQAAVDAVRRIGAALDAVPVLVAIGPVHGDEELARELGPALPARFIVDRAGGLREIAALIAHSQGYVGSSLHGLITALSYRRPAIAVAQPRMVKFLGLLGPLGLADNLHESWEDAAAAAPEQLRPLDRAALAALTAAEARIEAHWRSIRDLIEQPVGLEKLAARRRLLAALDAVPARFPQWQGLLDEIAGRAENAAGIEAPAAAPDTDRQPAQPESAIEADALTRLLAGDSIAEFENRLEQALARWPTEVRFQLLRSDLLVKSGDRNGADRILRHLCELHPRNPWPKARLTQLLISAGRLTDARALFEREVRGAALPEPVKEKLIAALASDSGDAAAARS